MAKVYIVSFHSNDDDQHGLYLLDRRRTLLPEDLVSDDPGEHMAGDILGNGGAGKRHDGG